MLPHELDAKRIKIPATDNHSIVLITGGGSPRHKFFGYRMRQVFGEKVIAWFQCGNIQMDVQQATQRKMLRPFRRVKVLVLGEDSASLSKFISSTKANGILGNARRIRERVKEYRLWRRRKKEQLDAEQRVFGHEMDGLKYQASMEPELLANPNSSEFIEKIRELNPYFLLTLGGPLYGRNLLESIRGFAINQHAGWSPDIRGSNTVEWALYHRKIDWVGSTIHITTTGADAGPILRRSQACLVDFDTPETCFVRVVALGTELMIEVVQDMMMRNEEITVYEQPMGCGTTFLGKELSKEIIESMYKDFESGWLKLERHRLWKY